MKIAWSVKLPKGATLKIKSDQAVEVGDLVYEYHENFVKRLPLAGWQEMGVNDRKSVLRDIVKKELTKDQVLWKGGWFSNIVLKSPGEGVCVGIDEFGNIELESEKNEKYLAPVSTKKVRLEKDKIIFELKGLEFEVEGVNQLKCWGDFEAEIFEDLNKISSNQVNKIVVVHKSLEAAIKAEAIGAAGLILVDVEKFREFEDSEIPVVRMTIDEAKKLVSQGKHNRVWINATSGKVLVVLE